jgi:hypothetical protein
LFADTLFRKEALLNTSKVFFCVPNGNTLTTLELVFSEEVFKHEHQKNTHVGG